MREADQPRRKLLLADANILIDLVQAGGVRLIGDLVRFGIAEVHVPRTIYDEVSREISESKVVSLGITILPVTEDLSRKVLAYPDRRLSRPDRALLLMAKEMGYGVWSNDRILRANCVKQGVEVFWEFQVLLELVTRGHLTKEALVALARAVGEKNIFMKEVADDLANEL